MLAPHFSHERPVFHSLSKSWKNTFFNNAGNYYYIDNLPVILTCKDSSLLSSWQFPPAELTCNGWKCKKWKYAQVKLFTLLKKRKQKERGRLEDHINWQQTEINKMQWFYCFFFYYKGQFVEMLVYVRVKAAQMLQRHLHVSFFPPKMVFFL